MGMISSKSPTAHKSIPRTARRENVRRAIAHPLSSDRAFYHLLAAGRKAVRTPSPGSRRGTGKMDRELRAAAHLALHG